MNTLPSSPVLWAAFVLIACRVGTVVMIAPLFGSRSVPAQLKIGLTLVLSLVFLPLALVHVTTLPDSLPAFLVLVARELFIGAIIGFAVQVLFAALQAGGQIIGLQVGFSLANLINPLSNDHSSLIDQFYGVLATLLFLTMDGHHALILAMQESFDLLPLGRSTFGLPPASILLHWGTDLFLIATRMALPLMAALLLADVALAVVARSVPQLNVFVVGMPAKIAVAFALLIVTVPVAALIMTRAFAGLEQSVALLLQGM